MRKIINKCVRKCIDLQVASLVVTSFGAAQHGYSANEFFDIVCNEIQQLDIRHHHQCLLKRVALVHTNGMRKERNRTIPSLHSRRRSLQSRRHSTPAHVDTSTKENDYCIGKFEWVNVVLKSGDVTSYEADAIINILFNSSQSTSDSSICEDILKVAGQAVQEELTHTRSNHNYSIFTTTAGGIHNVNEIIHVIPASSDCQGLQSSLEHCFDFVKRGLHSKILFPVAEIMSLNVSMEDLVNLILVAAENVSTAGSENLAIVVLTSQRKECSHLKSLVRRQTQSVSTPSARLTSNAYDACKKSDSVTFVSSCDGDDDELFSTQGAESSTDVCPNDRSSPHGIYQYDKHYQMRVPRSKRKEDKITLGFVGFQSNVDESVSLVTDFLDTNKAEKSITFLKNNFNFRDEIIQHLETFASIYHVAIYLQYCKLSIEGVKDNVFDCANSITDVLAKYEINEQSSNRQEEFSAEKKISAGEKRGVDTGKPEIRDRILLALR